MPTIPRPSDEQIFDQKSIVDPPRNSIPPLLMCVNMEPGIYDLYRGRGIRKARAGLTKKLIRTVGSVFQHDLPNGKPML